MTARPPPPPARVAAFFDFDDTIINTSAGRLFGKELLRMRWRRTLDTRPGTLGWAVRLVGQALYLTYAGLLYAALVVLHWLRIVKRSTVVRTAYKHMRGWRLEEIDQLGRDYFDEVIRRRFYPEALAMMKRHKDEGHVVVVATTNMRLLVENIRRYAPVDHVIGAELVTRDGRLTGGITGPTWGQEKAEAVRQWAHEHDVSLPRSHAYSDHFSDHDFLGLVGHPHAVNAGFRLRRMARHKGWTVHRFLPAEKVQD